MSYAATGEGQAITSGMREICSLDENYLLKQPNMRNAQKLLKIELKILGRIHRMGKQYRWKTLEKCGSHQNLTQTLLQDYSSLIMAENFPVTSYFAKILLSSKT